MWSIGESSSFLPRRDDDAIVLHYCEEEQRRQGRRGPARRHRHLRNGPLVADELELLSLPQAAAARLNATPVMATLVQNRARPECSPLRNLIIPPYIVVH